MKRSLMRLLAVLFCLALMAPAALAETAGPDPTPEEMAGPDLAPEDEVYAEPAEDAGAVEELEEFELEAPDELPLSTGEMESAAQAGADPGIEAEPWPWDEADGEGLPPAVAASGDRAELSGWVGSNPLEFANAVISDTWGRFYDTLDYNNSGYAADVFTFVHYGQSDPDPTFRLICVSPYSWTADAIEVWHDSGCTLLGLYPGMYGSDIKTILEGWGWAVYGTGDETIVYMNGNGYYLQVFAPRGGMGRSTGLSFFNQRFIDYYWGWRPDEGFLGNQDATSLSLSPSRPFEVTLGQFFSVIPYTQPDRAIMGLGWGSSNGNAVSMNTSAGRGIFYASNPGISTLSALTTNGLTASVLVRVVDPANPPRNPTLTAGSLTLGVGESFNLADSVADCAFTTDNGAVVSVSADGVVTAVSAGTATVTAADPFGYSASCLITVLNAPEKIVLNKKKLKLTNIGSAKLVPTLVGGSGTVTFRSTNNRVASVDADGTVRGVTIGSAKIIATTFNGKKAVCKVTVTRARSKAVKYRALLIGEADFPGTDNDSLPSRNDVSLMAGMLKSVKGPCGNKWRVYTGINRTSAQILSDIRRAFRGAKERDVSLFYIGTHGDSSSSIFTSYEYAGQLLTYPDIYGNYGLTLSQLAECLAEVPGKVVVFIDACGSGAAIYGAKGGASGFDPKAFNRAAVNAFAEADPGLLVSKGTTGALAVENKFYVLTSSAYLEMGWTTGGRSDSSYFAKWISNAVGRKGAMSADKNKDKYLTLKELYSYVAKKGNNTTMRHGGKVYRQHAQAYPSGSRFELFYR